MTKPVLIVGLCPSKKLPADWPPLCGSRSGERLAVLLGLTSSWDLRHVADLANILDAPHEGASPPSRGALRRAAAPMVTRMQEYPVTVALGTMVARALHRNLGPCDWSSDGKVLCLPHPSGTSRWWNKPDNAWVGRELLREAFRRARMDLLAEERV